MQAESEHLDSKKLVKRAGRRAFLKTTAASLLAGTLTGAASYYGISRVKNRLVGIVVDAEKEIRELALNIKVLSGALEKNLADRTAKLEGHYANGKLRIYEKLGIADPAEISEFERIIENSNKFEEHYNFAERARIYKDRIDAKLLSLDQRLEEKQPGAMRKINDAIRDMLGKQRGAEGQAYRSAVKQRLDELCRIYATNENNRIAETKVLERINQHLRDTRDLLPEERELFEFLRENYRREGGGEQARRFIERYEGFDESNEALLELRAHITESERLFEDIRENKTYITKLQEMLKEGIKMKEEARQRAPEEFGAYREEIQKQVTRLKGSVDTVITELQAKGYPIETREQYIARGTFGRMASRLMDTLVTGGSLAVGGVAAGVTWLYDRKRRKLKAVNAALEEAVKKYNEASDRYINNKEGKSTEGTR